VTSPLLKWATITQLPLGCTATCAAPSPPVASRLISVSAPSPPSIANAMIPLVAVSSIA
jgi:hypothetical protein